MLYKIVLTYQVKRIIKSWPESVQLKLTSLVLKLSFGEVLSASDAKAMTVIATSCRELRVKDPAGQYRAFYLLKQPHGVIIFHAFQKKT
ncbi:MAG: type II toxin-antitoxin system RelE/ParE family toxin, partial [Bacteriovoracia bacterium]